MGRPHGALAISRSIGKEAIRFSPDIPADSFHGLSRLRRSESNVVRRTLTDVRALTVLMAGLLGRGRPGQLLREDAGEREQ